jgi:type I restriction enzyme, R subunit
MRKKDCSKAAAADRRLTLREIIEKVFGLIPRFKSKDELLEEEFDKFVADYKPEEAAANPAIKTYFKAYVTSGRVRDIIESRQFTDLALGQMLREGASESLSGRNALRS